MNVKCLLGPCPCFQGLQLASGRPSPPARVMNVCFQGLYSQLPLGQHQTNYIQVRDPELGGL